MQGLAPLMASSLDELHLKFKFPRLEIVHNLLTILFRGNFIKKLFHTHLKLYDSFNKRKIQTY